MKSAKEFREELDALCFTWNGESLLGDDAISLIEARDSEHAAALAESQKRVAELEAEVESLKGGVNPRSMPMNNRSMRMK